MKIRAIAAALSRCRATLRRWLRFTWMGRLPLLGPRPWHMIRRSQRRAGQPPSVFRPSLEWLESRWTPDDILSAATAPVMMGGLVLLAGSHLTPLRLLLNSAPPAADASPPQPDTSVAPYRYTDADDPLFIEGGLSDLAFVAALGQTPPEDGMDFVHNSSTLDEPAKEMTVTNSDAGDSADPSAASAWAAKASATTSPPAAPPPADSPVKYAGAGGGGGAGGSCTPNAGMGGGGPTGGGSANLHLPSMTSLQRFLSDNNVALAASSPAANMPAVVTHAAAPQSSTPAATPPSATPATHSPNRSTGNTAALQSSTLSLSSSAASAKVGQLVTFTATVGPAAKGQTPTGTVLFSDGGKTLGDASLKNGSSAFTTSKLTPGSHSITAQYLGDSRFHGSQGILTETIHASGSGKGTGSTHTGATGDSSSRDNFKASGSGSGTNSSPNLVAPATGIGSGSGTGTHNYYDTELTVTLKSTPNPSVYSQMVTFTASVSTNGNPFAYGTIDFIGDGSLHYATIDSAAQATYTTSDLRVGKDIIVATYQGIQSTYGNTTTYVTSNLARVTQTVAEAPTAVALTASPNPSSYSQMVTFTATVQAVAPTTATPTGQVLFEDGSTALGTALLTNGQAALSTSALKLGTHDITAVYEGDGNFLTSQVSLTQTVDRIGTTTMLYAFPNPSVYGQKATFIASVQSTGTGWTNPPTGDVAFDDGSTLLGTAVLNDGEATFSTSGLTVGSHALTAVYNGDSNYLGSSGALNQTVVQAGTTTTLSSSLNPSSLGQDVTFTATVHALSPSAVIPAGLVVFEDGSTTLGNAALNSAGVAALSSSALANGLHDITAIYKGNSNDRGSQASLPQTVGHAGSATTLTATPNPSVYGQQVTFTATVHAVAPASGTPDGTVVFADGPQILGSVLLSNGRATLSTSALPVGNDAITADYKGDSAYLPSTASFTQTVAKARTSMALTSSLNPSGSGQMVTFAATVGPISPSNAAPTGVVLFEDGTIALGSAFLNTKSSSGPSTATFQDANLSVGVHKITAVYADNADDNGSQAALNQTVTNSGGGGGSGSVSVVVSYTDATISPLMNTKKSGGTNSPEMASPFESGTSGTLSLVPLTEGQVYTGTVLKSLYNPDSTTQYSEIIDWGDGSKRSKIAIGSASSPLPTLSHAYTLAGSYRVIDLLRADYGTATNVESGTPVTHPVKGTTTLETTALVLPVPLQADNLSIHYGATITNATVATFIVNEGDASNYQATIDWGDGSGPQEGTVGADGNGVFSVEGSHTYKHPGAFLTDVRVTGSDDSNWQWSGAGSRGVTYNPDGDVREASGTVFVTSSVAAPDLNLAVLGVRMYQKDSSDIFKLAYFTVGNHALTSGAFAATIDWGDGSAPSLGEVDGSDGAFTVSGMHSYAHPGQYLLKVNVGNPTDTASGWGTAHVSAPNVNLVTQNIVDGSIFGPYVPPSDPAFNMLLATFDSPNPSLTAADFDATVDFGIDYSSNNENISQATVTGSAGTFWVWIKPQDSFFSTRIVPLGSLDAYAPTQFLARLQIKDTVGDVLAANDFVYTSENWAEDEPYYFNPYYNTGILIPDNLFYIPITPFVVHVIPLGGQSNSSSYFSSSIDFGNGVTIPGTGPGSGSEIVNYYGYNSSFYTIGGIFGISSINMPQILSEFNVEEGSYTAKISFLLSTSTSTLATTTQQVSVADNYLIDENNDLATLTPTAGVTLASVPVAEFVDEDYKGAVNDYTATIDWGDGAASQGAIVVEKAGTITTGQASTFVVQGTHAYQKDGDYTVSVLIHDIGGTSIVTTLAANSPPPPPPPPPVSLSAQIRSDDPDRSLLVPSGEATVDPNMGAVRISQQLDFDASPGTTVGGNPALVYNSATADGVPILQVTLASTMTPKDATLSVTWEGVTLSNIDWTPPANQHGPKYVIDVPITTGVTGSGVYDWSIKATVDFTNDTTGSTVINGQSTVVVNTSSPYGAGWGLQSTSRLVSDTNGDMLLIQGYGDARLFTNNNDANLTLKKDSTFTSPKEDFGTLTGGLLLGYYLYTAQDQTKYYYDLNRRLTSIAQPNGWTTTYTYKNGLLNTFTTPDLGATTLSYTSGGLLSTIKEPGGRTVSFVHDSTGDLTTITSAAGYSRVMTYNTDHLLTQDQWAPYDTTFSYDANGLLDGLSLSPVSYSIVSDNAAQLLNPDGQPLATIKDGVGDITTYLLDDRGRKLTEIQPDGASDSWLRDDAGNATQLIDFNGLKTTYSYDDFGDVTQANYADGCTESWQYDPTYHNVTVHTDPDGHVTKSAYDKYGELTAQTIGYGSPQQATTAYAWLDGLVQTTIDPDGNKTVYGYTGFLLTSETLYNAAGIAVSSQSYGYDAAGNQTLAIDSDGGASHYVYDGDNNLLSTTDPDGHVSGQSYDAAGMVTQSSDGRGIHTDYVYDAAGLETTVTAAAGTSQAETTKNVYNGAGEEIASVDPDLDLTSYFYNVDGLQTLMIQGFGTPQAASIASAYDEDGNLTESIDADGHTSSYAYDKAGNQTLAIHAYNTGAATSTSSAYDADGNLTLSVDGDGDGTSYQYDADGNQTEIVTAAGTPQAATTVDLYDGDGNLIESIDADGNTSTFLYDALGGLVQSTIGTAVTKDYYDGDGNRIEQIDADGNVTSYIYDPDGNLMEQISGDGASTASFAYDADGNQTLAVSGYTSSNPESTSYAYDDNGNQVQVVNGWNARPVSTLMSYDGDNQLIQEVSRNSTTSTFLYDALGDVIQSTVSTFATTNAYDGDGNLTLSVDADGHTTSYQYDADGNLTLQIQGYNTAAAEATSYAYDHDGNQTLVVVGYDGSHPESTSYAYDGNGNQTLVVTGYGSSQLDSTVSKYDGDGNLIQQIDPDGYTSDFFYDSQGDPIASTEGIGSAQPASTSESYDGDGNVILSVDEDKNTTSYQYDADGNETLMIQGMGSSNPSTTSYAYDANGNQVLVVTGGGTTAAESTSYAYDADGNQTLRITGYGSLQAESTYWQHDGDGNVTEQIDADGNTSSYAYDVQDNLMLTQVGAAMTQYYYDGDGNLYLTIDAAGNSTEYDYDAAGNQTLMIQGVGTSALSSTVYGYDSAGNQTLVVVGYGSSHPESTSYAYDANGNRILSVDGDGNSTSYQYDADGNLTQQTDPNGNVSNYNYDFQGDQTQSALGTATTKDYYDGNGNLTLSVDADGNSTSYQYDAEGHRTLMVQGGNDITSYGYDASGNQILVVEGFDGANAESTSYLYDAAGHVIQQIAGANSFQPETTSYSYDGDGQLTQSIDADGNTSVYSYDAQGDQIETIAGLGSNNPGTTHESYDGNGNLILSVNAVGDSTSYQYDADGNQTLMVSGAGTSSAASVHYVYDAAGNQIQEIDPDGNTTSYAYDADGNETLMIQAGGDSTSYQYDKDGNLTSQTNPNGTSIKSSYNDQGEVTSETWYAGSTTTNSISYSYDGDGNILSACNNAGAYSFAYNTEGEVTQSVDPNGVTLNYQYDSEGHATQITDSLGDSVTSIYNSDGNLVQRSATGPNGAQIEVDLTYDDDNNPTSLIRKGQVNGTLQMVGGETETYDAQGNLTYIVQANAAGTTLDSFSYSYDPAGELKQEVDYNTGTTDYSYDATGQLIAAGATAYSYDANGNPNQSGDSVGVNNELSSDGTWNYSYDANGNLIGKTGVSNGLTWIYSYDVSNELIGATETNSQSQTLVQATYTYDVFGHCIESSVSTDGGAAIITKFVYNGDTLCEELNSGNSVQMFYVAGDQPDQWLARIDGSGAVGWYLTDDLGSVRDVMNNSSQIIAAADYDAFGNPVSIRNPSQLGSLEYVGLYWNAELGALTDAQRIYGPDIHRFWTEDSTGLQADSNEYRYVQNDPTNLVDPSGQDAVKPGRVSQIVADYEQTGTLPSDLLESLLNPADRAVLAAAGDSAARARVLERIQNAYQPVLDAMKPVLDDIAGQRRIAQNPLAKLLAIPQDPETEKAYTKGLQVQRVRQLANLDLNYQKAASGLVWDRLYAKNLEWAKKYYASESREAVDTFESILPWIWLPGVQSSHAAMGKMVPGETPEETARLMTEYMLSGRYHPTLNPREGKAAERAWMQESLLRALPVLVVEGAAEFGGMALSEPLGKLAGTITEKTGITKAAGLLRRSVQVTAEESADFVGPPLSRAGTTMTEEEASAAYAARLAQNRVKARASLNGAESESLPLSQASEQIPSPASSTTPSTVRATEADFLNPRPNTFYESNGYYYHTDAEGRLFEVSGDLRLGKATRNNVAQNAVGKSSGLAGDEGGHMIGSQFEGLGEGPLHMVPQAQNLNRGTGSEWTAMERQWADALRRGDKVSVRIEIEWPSASASRPNGFHVRYEITEAQTGIVTPRTKYFTQ